MTKVLVTYASLHGSTAGIAGWIADELRAHGIDAWAAPAAHVPTFVGVDAAVIGSAVYLDRWMHEASDLVHRHAAQLRELPVWLFSSGPLAEPDGTSVRQQDRLAEVVHARGTHVFGGAVVHGTNGPVSGDLGPFRPGDWRDEHAVRRWAREIAHDLTTVSSAS